MPVPQPLRGDPFNVPLPDQWDDPDLAPAMQGGMTDDELLPLLQREEDTASSFRNGELAQQQADALDYYDARPLGNEVEGQSQVVVPDVAETVDYMTMAIAEACASGEIVEFKPKVVALDQVEAAREMAREATEAVKEAFFEEQDGYGLLIAWAQSGLVEKIGVAKTALVTQRRVKRERLKVDAEQLAALHAGMHPERPGSSLVDAEQHEDGSFTAHLRTPMPRKRYLDMAVPSEELIFSMRARHEDDSQYIAQRSRQTRSDLVEMGFDRATVADLTTEGEALWWGDPRATARWGDTFDAEERDGALAEVTLLEEYIRADRDGDGVAELLQVFRVGETILEVAEVDEQPFVVFCPFPRAHRMVGDSAAEKVMDIQALRTMVTRQTIDGVILSNQPRGQIDENSIGESTIDDWLTAGPRTLIRTRGGSGITPLTDAFDPSQGLGLLQFLVGERESRTGMTRLNQGLNSQDLQVETATAFSGLQKQGQRVERYVARNFGNAVGRLFRKKVRLMIAEGDPLMVQIDGQYRQTQPGSWHSEMPVKVKIGSGDDVEVRLQRWQILIADQNALKANGSTLVSDENMYRARDGAIRDMGLGTPNEFYTDPSTPEAQQAMANQPPKQDPKAIEAQGKAALAQQTAQQAHEQAMAKLQLQQQAQQASATLDAQRAEQDAQLKAASVELENNLREDRAAQEAQLAHARSEAEAQLALRQQEFNEAMAERKMAFEQAMAERRHEHDAALAVAGIPGNRPGGDLDK